MHGQMDYPFDIRLDASLVERLRQKTEQIHRWASLPTEPVFTHDNQDAPVGRFSDYKAIADDHDLYIGGGKPGLAPLTQMQGRIAYRAHGLAYCTVRNVTERRWTIGTAEEQKDHPRRDDGFLFQLTQNQAFYGFTKNPNIVARKTISKVDLALIAHCYQTPVEIWEAWDPKLFQFWLRRAASGVDLFGYDDLDYLIDYATETMDLTFIERPATATLTVTSRGPLISDPPVTNMQPGKTYGFAMPLPPEFPMADILLFQADETGLYLISTPIQCSGQIRHNRIFCQPRAETEWGGMRFAPSERAIFLLLATEPGLFSLDELPFFADTLSPIPREQIAALRRRLFRSVSHRWRLYRRTLPIHEVR